MALGPWAVGPGVELTPLGVPLQLRYLSQFLCTICECGTSPFLVSAPPNNLDMTSSLIP